jgi:ATP-dependent helicase/nuclease subunit A
MGNQNLHQLPDAAERTKIETNLDTNYLVEAAAGTGKTTSMVRRMAALVASGKAPVHQIAAVTFTRKAASELKVRFILQLEEALAEAVKKGDGERADRIRGAAENAGRCFVGTIHSFCARLLRERPVEAGVDPAFTEMDEDEDERMRRVSWEEQVSGLGAGEEIDRILTAGLSPGELFGLFETVAGQPDVNTWPAPEPVLPDMAEALGALTEYLAHLEVLLPQLPDETGSDTLIPRMRRVRRMARNARNLSDPLTLFQILEPFSLSVKPVQRNFPGKKDQALAEAERWERFNTEVAAPAVAAFKAYRYAVALKTVLPAVDRFRKLRTLTGSLNYGDLLLRAAALLRQSPEVRRFFKDRYRYLLVDEFQDTDPVQAEVMMYLTATDAGEKDTSPSTTRSGTSSPARAAGRRSSWEPTSGPVPRSSSGSTRCSSTTSPPRRPTRLPGTFLSTREGFRWRALLSQTFQASGPSPFRVGAPARRRSPRSSRRGSRAPSATWWTRAPP